MSTNSAFQITIKHLIKSMLPEMSIERHRAHVLTRGIFTDQYPTLSTVKKPIPAKTIIYTADGRGYAGGMADRLRGIVSLYKIAKRQNFTFKINMSSPFDLTRFLQPNLYDWRIQNDDISYHPGQAIIYTQWSGGKAIELQESEADRVVRSFLKKYDQIHYTTNIQIADNEYPQLFDELFKPTRELQEDTDFHLAAIGCDFISATFRFQQLLGDFVEGNYPVLPKEEQSRLISRCISHLEEIFAENSFSKVLVTSDSVNFLAEANKLDFVYVVPGNIAHLDYSVESGASSYMKSFLDYYLLTHSKKIYLVIDGQMYDSGFPHRAALHGKSIFVKKKYS